MDSEKKLLQDKVNEVASEMLELEKLQEQFKTQDSVSEQSDKLCTKV